MHSAELYTLVKRLLSEPKENEWLEFKENNFSPEKIGERISALANGAALTKRPYGYLIFGVEDEKHVIVGTDFNPLQHKVGKEELEAWLTQRLNPRIDFRISVGEVDGKRVAIFKIPAAMGQPIAFEHRTFVRVGSTTRNLRDFPEKERQLWMRGDTSFEREIALKGVSAAEVVALLDTQAIFDIFLKKPYPTRQEGVIEALLLEKLIVRENGHYNITNLGAILFAKDLRKFDTVARKAPRVVLYKGKGKLETLKDQTGQNGYVVAFEKLMLYLSGLLPSNEVIKTALRNEVQMYPPIAIRELVGNALIHQDFRERGIGVMIEIFDDRVEISNPGQPMIDPLRFIDNYQSRNEALAAVMRRCGFCEEKGSGIDKVFHFCEVWQLPAPDFQVNNTHTKAILYAHKELAEMDKADKVRACYQHCCLQYVTKQPMTNQTLCKRFKIDDTGKVSRIIRETISAGLIKPEDSSAGSRKFVRYLPSWA